MNHETKSLLNVISNLLFSIIIPITILNSTKIPLSPELRLMIAILFPLLYGAFEWWQTKKHNFLTLFGLLNVIITGGFGLLHLEGMWFSIKEASFPLLIGLFIMASGIRHEPLFGKMLMSPELFNRDKLDEKIRELNKRAELDLLLKRCNHFLSISFFISALLNFIIALKTFLPINELLSADEKSQALNEQIALMHKRGFLGIAIPSMIMLIALLSYYFKQIEKLTGEGIDSYLHQSGKK